MIGMPVARDGAQAGLSGGPSPPSFSVRDGGHGAVRGVMAGGVWNGFLLGVHGEEVTCRFCGEADNDGHLFRECSYPPLVHLG